MVTHWSWFRKEVVLYERGLDAKDFVNRSKAKAKPQRKELAGSSSRIIHVERRNWIDTEPGNILSLRTKFR